MLPAVLGSLIALAGCRSHALGLLPGSPGYPSPSRSGPAAGTGPRPAAPPATRPAVVTPVISPALNSLVLGPGAVFAATYGEVFRIDPQTGQASPLIKIRGQINALAYGAGSLWVATGRTLYRVSPAHRRVLATIGVPATGIAHGAGALWAINWPTNTIGHGTLTRVNTTTNRPSATLPMTEPTSVVAGEGGVWAGTDIAPIVYRIDPRSVRVTARVKVCGGRGGPQLAIAAGAVWAANAACGTVSRINPRTGSIRATITVCKALRIQCGGPIGLVLSSGGGYLWVFDEPGPHNRFARIDPATGRATPGVRIPAGAGPIQATAGSVWIVMGNGRIAKYRV